MDNNYRGTVVANLHYFFAILLYFTFSPFSLFTIIFGLFYKFSFSVMGLGGLGFIGILLVNSLPIIGFWIWKKGLLPVHEEGERLAGIVIVAIANFLVLIGIGVFWYFASQAKGGGTISGVPLGMWGMLCMLIQLIGMIFVEWKRWGNSSNPKIFQLIALGVLAIPALFVLLPILFQIMMNIIR
ncbi:hypothetical protein [Kangiella sediminilitoris]|uniref:Uncharacterized protein n=1 Tax=Kangiella sediminilitoris TaxID=1144748 RepID=A0A1B3BC48_9GAMM|nr:hypothetical protein [Kangiella sediminilitoris]AOE50374.1 hypothetical protein KS2013_1664 [Kangiella sediminilitoris]